MSKSENLFGFTPEQVKLIRETVGKDAVNEAEFQRFLYRADKLGLNPLDGTIHLQLRNRKTQDGNWEKVNILMVGIDGFRAVGDGTGKLNGIKRGVNRDENGRLTEGWAEIYRKDWEFPAREVVPFREYIQLKDGHPTGLWATKPETMLKKCAEAAAHRMAWAGVLAGIYIPEEIPEEDKNGNAPKGDPSKGKTGETIPSGTPTEPPKDTAGQPATEKPAGGSAEPPKDNKRQRNTANNKAEKQQNAASGESNTGSAEPPKDNAGATEKPAAGSTEPPKDTAGQKTTENPAGNPPENKGDQKATEPFDGELVVMSKPEPMKQDPWVRVVAFTTVSEETVYLMSNDGILKDIGPKDLVQVQGERRGNSIKVNKITVMQKAGAVPGQQPAQNVEQKPAETPKAQESAEKTTGEPAGESVKEGASLFTVVIKSTPVAGKKSGKDILWARGEVGGNSLLVVAQDGYCNAFGALKEGMNATIKGTMAQEGAKKSPILYFEGISEAA